MKPNRADFGGELRVDNFYIEMLQLMFDSNGADFCYL